MAVHKPLYIPDASVLIKWALLEAQNLQEAIQFQKDVLRQEIEIIAPSHCFTEVCNLLARDYKNIAISFFSFLLISEIVEYRLTLDLVTLAVQLMDKYSSISFYDASYHALALQEQGTFITADEKYYRKTHKEGHVMLLKDYGKKRYAGQ